MALSRPPSNAAAGRRRSGTVLPARIVTLQNGRITKVEPAPAGRLDASVVDLSDSTCLPGLIDGTFHLIGDATIHATLASGFFCSASHCLGA